ncbi:helix-turn-helix domain-containing protein [Nakamurella lactea]|uniref:helix-turn-helix domain-containing protein n=1 Tax=Nakamurella lactea TaxID=459515 RepID=UPI00056643C5|nr:helix-turn-helix domain-containing protein [Nakamurella lactea]
MTLTSVAVLVPEGTAPFEFGLIYEVFGVDRTDEGVPRFDFRVCGRRPGEPITFGSGMRLEVPFGLDAAVDVDLLAMPAFPMDTELPTDMQQALRLAHDNGATVLSVCSGAFGLGAAGLLDERPCTTHWRYADELAARYPRARIDRDVLFVDDGDLITSAGTAAGIDACLHLVRRELGSAVATTIARRMVVPPQRDGGQRQFIDLPIPECTGDSLEPVLSYLIQNLAAEHTVSELARRATMSERTFARRFVAETGSTPAKWLALQRLHHARHLLEETDLGVEQVAARTGFGTAAQLRHHFTRAIGVPPVAYRRSFTAKTG